MFLWNYEVELSSNWVQSQKSIPAGQSLSKEKSKEMFVAGCPAWFHSHLAPNTHTDAILIIKLLASVYGFLLASSVLLLTHIC